jgi:hypothetical protein
MDEKEKDLEIPDEVVDNDKIDLKEEDEVTEDDFFDSDDESEDTEIANEPEIESRTDIELDGQTDSLDTSKTVGEAIEEAETSKGDVFAPDSEVDAAVDDIVRTESDESIAQTDAKLSALAESKNKRSFKDKIRGFFSTWWNNKPARYGTIVGIFILFTAIILMPTSRYAVLNLAGVRVKSSMTVVDSETKLPLKNIHVQIQDKYADTDEDGNVSFDDLKLGNSQLLITKAGYADTNKQVVLGWGSNPIGEQDIVATGEQFTFVLSDWKSDQKIVEAEAISGESSAKADENGKIILTIGLEDIDNIEVTIKAENYREEILSGDELLGEIINLKMVPGKTHAFVSNRDNQYDLYKIDVDGQNEKSILKATGKEREVPMVTIHPSRNITAFVSSRDGDENSDKFILDGLFIVDLSTDNVEKIGRSEQIQVIGWHNDKLVYLQIVEGTSAGSSQRSKIISYDINSGEKTDLATANYFNDVELVGDTLYYAVSSYAVPESQAKLFTVKVDGKDTKKLIDFQVWNIFRTEYSKLLFSAENQKWYSVEKGSEAVETPQVSSPTMRNFVDSPNGELTAWVDIRDGKGVLLKSNTKEFSEEQVVSLPGLSNVQYWLNDTTLVFRVISNDETADYVINLEQGEPQKITDITASRNTYF